MTIRINYNRSIPSERSVINYCRGGGGAGAGVGSGALKNKIFFQNIYFPSKLNKLYPESLKERTYKLLLRSDATKHFIEDLNICPAITLRPRGYISIGHWSLVAFIFEDTLQKEVNIYYNHLKKLYSNLYTCGLILAMTCLAHITDLFHLNSLMLLKCKTISVCQTVIFLRVLSQI